MKSAAIDRGLLLAIAATALGDCLALAAELLSQRRARQEQRESEREQAALQARLAERESRIRHLEKA
ncbi:MAG: hypothetical protein E6X17_17855 [Sporomusaceae bacterium]|nr:hypothetical protein [Sporomusaceae bacterium]